MARRFGPGRDYIEIATTPIIEDAIFSVGFRFRSFNRANVELAGKHQANTSYNGWGINLQGGTPNYLSVFAKPGSGLWSIQDSSGLANVDASDGNWHSALCRFNRASLIEGMIDGVSIGSGATSAWSTASNPLRIGNSLDGFFADSLIDMEDFAYWTGRLSDDEARAFCRGAAPGSIRPASLSIWFPMRD